MRLLVDRPLQAQQLHQVLVRQTKGHAVPAKRGRQTRRAQRALTIVENKFLRRRSNRAAMDRVIKEPTL